MEVSGTKFKKWVTQGRYSHGVKAVHQVNSGLASGGERVIIYPNKSNSGGMVKVKLGEVKFKERTGYEDVKRRNRHFYFMFCVLSIS